MKCRKKDVSQNNKRANNFLDLQVFGILKLILTKTIYDPLECTGQDFSNVETTTSFLSLKKPMNLINHEVKLYYFPRNVQYQDYY